MKFLHISVLACLFFCSLTVGCGGSSENSVVQPSANYEPTAEEKAMQAEMDAARDGGQQ